MGLPKIKLGKGHNIMLVIMSCLGIFIIMIAFLGSGFVMAIGGYTGGWECRTKLHSVYIGSQTKWYDQGTAPLGDIPWGPKTVQFDPTSSADFPNWQYVQEPDIYINIDDPIHTSEVSETNHELKKDADGKVISTPEGEYVREIKKTVGNTTYFYYHHVYATMVSVRTDCDRLTQPLWQSLLETKGEEGVALVFTVRFEFIVDPWNIVGDVFTEGNTTYEVTEAFAGVMSASHEVVDAGFTDKTMQARLENEGSADVLTTVSTGWDWVKPAEHSSCNMYVRVGVQAPLNEVPEDPSTITGVPNRVLIDVSGTLWPGATQPWGALASPYELFMQLTVRIDVLCAAGFTPIVGTDELPDDFDDYKGGPVPFYYPLAYMLGELWGQWWWLVVVVIVIVFAILVLIVMTRIKALVRK